MQNDVDGRNRRLYRRCCCCCCCDAAVAFFLAFPPRPPFFLVEDDDVDGNQGFVPVIYYVVTCYYLVTQKLTQSFCSNRKPPYAWNMIKPDVLMCPMQSWLQYM